MDLRAVPHSAAGGKEESDPAAVRFSRRFSLGRLPNLQGQPTSVLHDGDLLDVGSRTLQVIHTPGHSPGHCCFYERDKGWLYSGDLIYRGCLDAFYPTTDPKQFQQSVRKVRRFEIDRVLPAHHQLTVPVAMVGRIAAAFDRLEDRGQLRQGSGLFDFGEFQIHI